MESISQMKPKAASEHEDGLLEYLEDIIGTTQYKQPIEEAFKVVEAMNEERTVCLNRVKIVDNHVKSLESQKREAEVFLESENELAVLHSKLYCKQVLSFKEKSSGGAEKLANAEEELKQAYAALTEAQDGLKEKTKEFADLQAVNKQLRAAAEEAKSSYSKFEREYIQCEEKKKHLKTKKKKLEKTLEKETYAVNEAERWLQNYAQDIEKKRAEVADFQERLVIAEADLDSMS